jgi:hypothetical protein
MGTLILAFFASTQASSGAEVLRLSPPISIESTARYGTPNIPYPVALHH